MGSFDFCTCVQPRTTKLAIVNRPHVSKSTLLNRIVCDDGVLTGPELGVTRDSVCNGVPIACTVTVQAAYTEGH
uniref:G domain-containing protein n=1 Tax=Hyaloperonospora arabidopsidis (strain Emoy2) TaxID=559515 RepID=M4BDU8_HYAAE